MMPRRGPHQPQETPEFHTDGVLACALCGLAGVHDYEFAGPCDAAPLIEVDPERSRAGKRSKNRGMRYELHVRDRFAAARIALRRTPASGGLHIKGDLIGLTGFHLEAKKVEALNIWKALDQAQRDAAPGQTPLVCFARNRSSDYVALPLDDFLGLLEQAGLADEHEAAA